ncbi:MAG: hypothetical protein J6N15_04215 [Ruminiclostridium sp.]|nr:hypothetical protein [Ruminiclostridium sp.]
MKPARKLTLGDACRVANFFNQSGITMKEIDELFDDSTLKDLKDEDKKNQAGMKFFGFIFEKAPHMEEPLYKVLAPIAGLSIDELKETALIDICTMIQAVFEENGDIADFFKQVYPLVVR